MFIIRALRNEKKFELLNYDHYPWTISANMTQTIRLNGFDAETHTVLTNDGYRLQLYRIVNPFTLSNITGYPILFFNGLTESAYTFITITIGWLDRNTGIYYEFDDKQLKNPMKIDCQSILDSNKKPNQYAHSIAFMLSACGYDVWLTNVRDNIYEASNLHYTIDDPQYWNITFDHYSIDAMANIDYVLRKQQQQRQQKQYQYETIGALCYSYGCTNLFQLMIVEEKYNQLIRPLFLLAPTIYIQSTRSLILILLGSLGQLVREIPQSTTNVVPILPYLANQLEKNQFLRIIYFFSLILLSGYNEQEFIPENQYRMLAYFPQTISLQMLTHIEQRFKSNNHLYRFDYGPKENLNVYGQIKPPLYNISKITNPYMILWYGSSDFISDTNDVEQLQQDLSVKLFQTFYTDYAHLDFKNGRTVNRTVVQPIIEILFNLGFHYRKFD
uniref:Gastric triacylglycerol lipase-like n=1 Tax=Dermatophagoides pteronyssinus TaxID=6956 RepID=A0A6P6Y8L9_DERPT|nr:gastric triacylglycerol lipase-like [Dermatophagoides pteronyssinus]